MQEIMQRYAFNRTIIELKQGEVPFPLPAVFAFNRTIIELKPESPDKIGLILKNSFNRTIIELKRIYIRFLFFESVF